MYLDLGAAADRLKSEASTLGLDLNRVAVVGHSAGAHLALWLGSRRKLGLKSPFHVADALPVRTVVAIAGPGDLRRDIGLMTINSAGLSTVSDVIGRDIDADRDRFADISPRELLPTSVRTVSITGTHDDNWPPYVAAHWSRAARSLGDDAEEVLLPNVGHFEVVDVRFDAWRAVRDIILAEVGRLS
jgi:acetyl esterase/lipase